MRMSIVGGIVMLLGSCGSAKPVTKAAKPASESTATKANNDDAPDVSPLDDLPAADKAKLMELLNREGASAAPASSFTTLDGAMTGSAALEGKGPIPCAIIGKSGEQACQADFAYGTIGNETATMHCAFIGVNSLRLGETLGKELGDDITILGPSAFTVDAVNDGIAMQLAIDYFKQDDFFTFKAAVLYARGTVTMCSDHNAGLRTTFRNATQNLFTSLRVMPNPKATVTFAAGYRDQAQGELTGFHVVTVVKTPEGSTETATYFTRLPKKFLAIGDHSHLTFRNPAGRHIREVAMFGDVRMDIHSTDKHFAQVSLQRNGKDKDWQLPAPVELNTEVDMAKTIAELASGQRNEVTYAIVTVDDIGPKMQQVKLTRINATTVREAVNATTNELTVDSNGYVSRQVSTDAVFDRIALYMP